MMNKLLGWLDRVSAGVATGFLTLVVILCIAQVLFRYVLNISINWTEELARAVFVWLAFLGSAVALFRQEHICIDFLLKRLPGRLHCVGELIIYALIAWFLYGVFRGSLMMIKVTRYMEMSAVPYMKVAHLYMILPLSIVLMWIHLVRLSVRAVKKTQSKKILET